MRIRIKEHDGVWVIKHINPKNIKMIMQKYEHELIDDDVYVVIDCVKIATTNKPSSPNAPLQQNISPHPCMYANDSCYDCPERFTCKLNRSVTEK